MTPKPVPQIPTPSVDEVNKYAYNFTLSPGYAPINRLQKLFTEVFPHNTNEYHVASKVCVLNSYSHVNLKHTYAIVNHLLGIKDLDARLLDGDLLLIEEIRHGIPGIDYYSFATKYCAFHQPSQYVVYDRYSSAILWHFIKESKVQGKCFTEVSTRNKFKDYLNYIQVTLDFIDHYKLNNQRMHKIDQYLWLCGKEFY